MDASPWSGSNKRPRVPKGRQKSCLDQPVVPLGLCGALAFRRFPGLTSGACACHRFAIHKKSQLQNSRIGLACHCDCVAPAPPVCDFVENPACIHPPRTQRHTRLSAPRCSLTRHHPQANQPKTKLQCLQSRSQSKIKHSTTMRPRFPTCAPSSGIPTE